MKISELKERYAAGVTPTDVIDEIWEKIIAWDDPAIFIHLPEKYELLALAAEVEAMPADLPLVGDSVRGEGQYRCRRLADDGGLSGVFLCSGRRRGGR